MIRPQPSDIGQEVLYRPHLLARWRRARLRKIIEASRPIDRKIVAATDEGNKELKVGGVRWADPVRARTERTAMDRLMTGGFGALLAGLVLFLTPLLTSLGALQARALVPLLVAASLLVIGGFAAIVAASVGKATRGELK